MTTVIVCGGRDFKDRVLFYRTMARLDNDYKFTLVIQGGATGADSLAAEWAQNHGVQMYEYAAQWRLYGKRAGPIRNQTMIDYGKPNLVIAFPGGAGTADMVSRARKAEIEVIEVSA